MIDDRAIMLPTCFQIVIKVGSEITYISLAGNNEF